MDNYHSEIKLKNGSEVFLRPIQESDRSLILDLFSKMPRKSLYLRFLRDMDELPDNLIKKLINMDFKTSFALVAISREEVISVSRYGYDPEEKTTDLAVAVRDDWQHLGLGEIMLKKIVGIAKENGITGFTGMMVSKNIEIKSLLQKLGYKVKYIPQNGFYNVDIKTM